VGYGYGGNNLCTVPSVIEKFDFVIIAVITLLPLVFFEALRNDMLIQTVIVLSVLAAAGAIAVTALFRLVYLLYPGCFKSLASAFRCHPFMSQKNETVVLLLSLLVTVALVATGLWWFTNRGGINLGGLTGSDNPGQQPRRDDINQPVESRISLGDKLLFLQEKHLRNKRL
jgi:hypothetical protein